MYIAQQLQRSAYFLALFSLLAISPAWSQTKIVDSYPDEPQPPSKYDPAKDHSSVFRLMSPELDNALVASALTDLLPPPGVREDPEGSNWGPKVKLYLASCRISSAAPWCAAFVNYHVRKGEARIKRFLQKPIMWPAYANVNDIYKWAIRHRLVLHYSNAPHRGCVFLVRRLHRRPGQGAFQHTGIVVGVDKSLKLVTTVEGNSNDNGTDEGIGVFKLKRHYDLKPAGRLVFVEVG